MVDVGDAPGERVLDRDHAEIGLAGGDRLKAVLEGRLRHGLAVGKDLEAGDVRVGAGLALEHHALARPNPLLLSACRRGWRARAPDRPACRRRTAPRR